MEESATGMFAKVLWKRKHANNKAGRRKGQEESAVSWKLSGSHRASTWRYRNHKQQTTPSWVCKESRIVIASCRVHFAMLEKNASDEVWAWPWFCGVCQCLSVVTAYVPRHPHGLVGTGVMCVNVSGTWNDEPRMGCSVLACGVDLNRDGRNRPCCKRDGCTARQRHIIRPL